MLIKSWEVFMGKDVKGSNGNEGVSWEDQKNMPECPGKEKM